MKVIFSVLCLLGCFFSLVGMDETLEKFVSNQETFIAYIYKAGSTITYVHRVTEADTERFAGCKRPISGKGTVINFHNNKTTKECQRVLKNEC